jgi:hypothetical protein
MYGRLRRFTRNLRGNERWVGSGYRCWQSSCRGSASIEKRRLGKTVHAQPRTGHAFRNTKPNHFWFGPSKEMSGCMNHHRPEKGTGQLFTRSNVPQISPHAP